MRDSLPVAGLILWYADGACRRIAPTVEAWSEAPDEGVQIAQVLYAYEYKGKHLQDVLAGFDFFWWHAGVYANTRAPDVPADCPNNCVKQGRTIQREEFIKLYNEAHEGVPFSS